MSTPGGRNRQLTTIREESALNTKRIPVHIIPPGARLGGGQGGMLIQTLPNEEPKPQPKVTPATRHHDNVQQVVSDYLHFARYGEVLPVSHGFSPSVCPCCMDRNRENISHIRQRQRAPPDNDPQALMEPELPSDPPSGASPRKQVGFSDTVQVREVSPRKTTRDGSDVGGGDPRAGSDGDFLSSWMSLQPQAHARQYLNHEFSRHSAAAQWEAERGWYEDQARQPIAQQVLDADTQYNLSMQRLQRSLDNFGESDRHYRGGYNEDY